MAGKAAGVGTIPIQILIVGGDLVTGVGDPRGLGWTGRVAAQSPSDPPVMFLPLGVPGETTPQLAERWEDEVERRLIHGHRHRLVVAPGAGDLEQGVSSPRARLALAKVLDAATQRKMPALVVGPAPLPSPRIEDVERLSRTFADVTTRRGIGYVDLCAGLATHADWLADAAAHDGHGIGQVGYGLIAWLVLNSGWYDWAGLEAPVPAP
jgi:hypothetical protein